MQDESVCIVLNPAFGQLLKKLPQDMPVWVVQSEENSVVAAELRGAGRKNVTTFAPQDAAQLLWTVDEHHPNWRKLEFHGLRIDDALREALSEFGPGALEPFGTGFIFERGSPNRL